MSKNSLYSQTTMTRVFKEKKYFPLTRLIPNKIILVKETS